MEIHKHPHHITHKKKWGEYPLGQQLSSAINLKQKGDLIREFYNAAILSNYQIRVYYLKLMQEQPKHASNLIELLQKEYNL